MADHLAAIKHARSSSELEKACFRATRAGCDRAAVSAARDAAATALADIDPRKHAQLVMDSGVFLGPFSVARDANELRRLGITHIVCLSAEGKCDIPGIVYEEHALVEVDCTLERGIEQLLACLPSCVAFVRNAVAADRKLLIHCNHGRTRSAAVAACVRAVLNNEDYDTAYQAVQRAREYVYVPEAWHPELCRAVTELQQ